MPPQQLTRWVEDCDLLKAGGGAAFFPPRAAQAEPESRFKGLRGAGNDWCTRSKAASAQAAAALMPSPPPPPTHTETHWQGENRFMLHYKGMESQSGFSHSICSKMYLQDFGRVLT